MKSNGHCELESFQAQRVRTGGRLAAALALALWGTSAVAQIGPMGAGPPIPDHPPGMVDGWLKTFGSSQGLADFSAEAVATGYGLVAMGGEYRGTLLDQSGATVAPTSASQGQTFYPAAFVAAAAADGTNFWSRGMVGVPQNGKYGSARTNAVAFGDPDVLVSSTVFAAGSYQNKVQFDTVGAGLQKTAVGTDTKDCYIASFGVATNYLHWVKTFPSVTATANDEIFGVAASGEFSFTGGELFESEDWDPTVDPATGTPPEGKIGTEPDPFSVTVVCGGFNGTIDFDGANPGAARATSQGSEDGFVVVLDQTSGNYLAHATFGGVGVDRAFAVALGPDPHFSPSLGGDLMPPKIYVCGFFTGSVSFGTLAAQSTGGRDGFIARLSMSKPSDQIVLRWDRLYTFGGPDQDVARSLSAEGVIRQTTPQMEPFIPTTFGRIAFTGWTGGGSAEGRELISGALSDFDDPDFVGLGDNDFGVDWEHELVANDNTDDAGLGVAWDRLGRVVVAGQFGVERVPAGAPTTASASFDPAGGDSKTTAGGWDAFIARYTSEGAYLDAAIYGGNYNDWATALAVDRSSEQMWVPGVFGHADASTSYNVGFGQSLLASCRGGADMYWLSLERAALPVTIDTMVSIVLDTSSSMLPGEPPARYHDYFDAVKASLVRYFEEEEFTVRRTGGLAFNVVVFGTDQTQEVVPWTVIDQTTAAAFASAVRTIAPIGGGTNLWAGVNFALDRFEASPLLSLTDAGDRMMLVIGDGCENSSPAGIDRAAVLARMVSLGWPAEVGGVPIGTDTDSCPGGIGVAQYYAQEVVTLSQAVGASQFLYPAAGTDMPEDPTHFDYQGRKIIKALTCCRADFNGNGIHDMLGDQWAFGFLHGESHPAADLNCDGAWTALDQIEFDAFILESCPCGF